jgi:hypothetical protein
MTAYTVFLLFLFFNYNSFVGEHAPVINGKDKKTETVIKICAAAYIFVCASNPLIYAPKALLITHY